MNARFLLLPVLALCCGCFVDLEVPAGALLTCESDADCPSGFACSPVFDECVKRSGDGIAPTVSSASLRCPAGFDAARAGDTVEVEFLVSEPLPHDPAVSLAASTRSAFQLKSRDGQRFTFALAVTDLVEEGRWNILATLVGADGDIGLNQPVAVLTVDHQRPALAGAPVVEPVEVRAGERFSITLSASEPLARAPQLELLTVESATAAELEGDPEQLDPRTWRFELVARDDGLAGTEAWASLGIGLTDRAGNSALLETPRAVRLDFRPPAVFAGSVRTLITSAPDNPLVSPAALTVGSRLDLWLSFDEPLAPGSAVELCAPTAPPLCQRLEADDSPVYRFTLEPTEEHRGLEATDYPLAVTATDRVGNLGSSPLPPVRLDTRAPAAPDPEATLQTRIPFGFSHLDGSRVTDHPAGFFVHADPGAVEPHSTVIIFADAAEGADELGRAEAAADGSLGADPLAAAGPAAAFALRRADRERLWAEAVDEAGNRSPRVALTRSVWVATLGSKAAGDTSLNPLSAWSLQALSFGPGAPREELGATDGLDRLDAHSVTSSVRGIWRERVLTAPVDQSQHALTYDSWAGQLLLYGRVDAGCTAGSSLAGCQPVWARQGREWKALWPPAFTPVPAARVAAAWAFDSRRGRALLLGGLPVGSPPSGALLADAWWWDGERWHEADAAGDPSFAEVAGRRDHAMVYDRARDRMVVFGGRLPDATLPYGTWEFDGTAWAPGCGGSCAQPRRRFGHALAWDSSTGKTLLFGGTGRDGSGTRFEELDDLWEYDGATWTQRCDGVPAEDTCALRPAARRHASLAWDEARGALVLLGGYDGAGLLADTWLWDGSAWTEVSGDPEGDGEPAARWAAAAAYDPGRARVVLVGGTSDQTWTQGALVNPEPGPDPADLDDEVWELTAGRWSKASPAVHGGPALNDSRPLAFDAARGVLLSWDSLAEKLWSWNGLQWQASSPADPAADGNPKGNPPMNSAYTYALAFDGLRQEPVLLGSVPWGATGATWTLHEVGPGQYDWIGSAAASPRADGAALAFDAERGLVMALTPDGDTAQASTFWEWAGTAWNRRCEGEPATDLCTLPPGMRRGALVYDAGRRRLVLVGPPGPGTFPLPACAQTWEWDGNDWELRAGGGASAGDCAQHPPASSDGQMVYDPLAQRSLWYSGQGAIWAWNGDVWLAIEPAGSGLPSSSRLMLGFFPPTGELVWALPDSQAGRARTLVWDSSEAWPSHLLQAPISGALPVFASQLSEGQPLRDAVEGVEIRWHAGGRGTSGQPAPGAELLLLRDGVWETAATHASEDPALLEAGFFGAQALAGLLGDSSGPAGLPELRVGVRARAAHVIALESDYVELRLHLRRP